jgi:type IV secretory pathway VirB2 component (pilin)
MKTKNNQHFNVLRVLTAAAIATRSAFAQGDPWTSSAQNLKTAFTGPIATALIAVAVVVCGLVFAFSEGQGKRQLSGIVFGGAMAIGAVRFMTWLFS